MARLDPSEYLWTPELSAARRQGPDEEEQVLLNALLKAEQEGDEEDVHDVLYTLISAYASRGDYTKTIHTLRVLDAKPIPDSRYLLHVADLLIQYFNDTKLALHYLQRGSEQLPSTYDVNQQYKDSISIKSKELSILSKADPSSTRVQRLLEELSLLAVGSEWYDDALVEALRILVPQGLVAGSRRAILERAWAEVVRRRQFGSGTASTLIEELEQLTMQVPAEDDEESGLEDEVDHQGLR